eukprot:4724443-Amphidinium_carterae.1
MAQSLKTTCYLEKQQHMHHRALSCGKNKPVGPLHHTLLCASSAACAELPVKAGIHLHIPARMYPTKSSSSFQAQAQPVLQHPNKMVCFDNAHVDKKLRSQQMKSKHGNTIGARPCAQQQTTMA